MADFCGLTRVKTWRWSRPFACAVAVFCAVTPIKAFGLAGAYTCQSSVYAVCNPGFYLAGMYPGNDCQICPANTYKAVIDDKNASGGGSNYTCSACPAHATCPVVTYSSNSSNVSYGRPLILCDAGYYREYTSDFKGLQCSSCNDAYTGSYKNADSIGNNNAGLVIDGENPPQLQDRKIVAFQDGYLGPVQCNKCASNYYQRGYYISETSSYTGSNRCAKCDNNVKPEGGCFPDGRVFCKDNFYRNFIPKSDSTNGGKVTCVACPNGTVKDADDDDTPDTPTYNSSWTCNRCESGAYYYSQRGGDVSCYECPTNSVKETKEGIRICNTTAMFQGGENDILCGVGHYRKTDTSTGKITCEQCPTGYTKDADTDADDAAANEELGAESCNKCAIDTDDNSLGVNWYSAPDGNNKCYPCPDVTSDGMLSCRDGGVQTHYLLCDANYYRVATTIEFTYGGEDYSFPGYKCQRCEKTVKEVDTGWNQELWKVGSDQCNGGCVGGMFAPNGNPSPDNCVYCPGYDTTAGTTNQTYVECGNGVLRCKANYYYYYDSTKESEDRQYECLPCDATVAGKEEDANNVLGGPTGPGQCNICAKGLFAPNGNPSPDNCVYCPDNAECTSDDLKCGANHYYHYDATKISEKRQYQCIECPATTGKPADTNGVLSSGAGSQEAGQCSICAEGWYGTTTGNVSTLRSSCSECPVFTRLDALGICVRGHTDRPDATSTSAFATSLSSCYMPNASRNVVGSNTLFGDVDGTVEPTFSDSEGIFKFVKDYYDYYGPSCAISGLSSELSGLCSNLGAGKHCVYISADMNGSNELNKNACIKAIMWRSKNSNDNFEISDLTAQMVYSHWGIDDPWFCTDDENKANAFKACLTGGNGASDDCKDDNNAYCATSSDVKICEIGSNGRCE